MKARGVGPAGNPTMRSCSKTRVTAGKTKQGYGQQNITVSPTLLNNGGQSLKNQGETLVNRCWADEKPH